MKHNTQPNFKRTTRIVKSLLAGLLIASSIAVASPAAADSSTTTVKVSIGTSTTGTYSQQVAWGGCGGNCGQ